MSDYNIDILTLNLAIHILDNKSTIRATAKEFNIPKSTVHNYLNNNLKNLNKQLYKEVKNLLQNNFKNKHIHGGESTRLKYQKLKNLITINDKYDFIIN